MPPPKDEYLSRINNLATAIARHEQRDRLLAGAKLTVVSITVILTVWLAKYHTTQIAYVFIPIVVLVAVFVWHERVLRSLRRCTRLRSFYEQGVARLEDRWAGTGQTGEQYLDPSHPYARDLDIFGKGGLFELLCTARTRAGESTLAAWLLDRASLEEIALRRESIQELAPKLDFRECLALAGEDVRVGVHPESLIAWSESKTRLEAYRALRIVLPLLAACWIASIAAWFLWDWGIAALTVSLLNLAITYKLHPRVKLAIGKIDEASHNLDILASVVKEIEAAQFTSRQLTDLQKGLRSHAMYPSHAIRRLSKRVIWLDSHEHWMVKVLDLFVFWTPQWVLAIEAWRALHGANVRRWIEVTGEVEALTSLGCYAYEHPADIFPEFVEQGPFLHSEAMAHPLLPRGKSVANDLALDHNLQLIVISGPNMAGKSTFIRCVGINVVLAQAGAPICARQLKLSHLAVAASICILDSLQGGLSRFYAEILRLKTIDEMTEGGVPILFLLDELLSGTNSHDRRVGTESFVRHLLARGAIGLITTHDLALAKIADDMADHAANYHFSDHLEDGQLRFDYKLTPGIVQTTNALKLMRSIGLEV
ncbi:DNA mismatch repair protein MutS [Alloacidobacterium dinghuense]|uniref:DNA mismatch repair protein MutS n=1 Tax=Alloacidobacterium dinghuense TaxID=2763107 RepID=A0A7G8BKE3_9BACT|nr:DNA mismatch repair protein MutS [Alloacidobacterium dinghuense]QNI33013.1 DNA mismatch repair protein MutS [Alloacidobacterium dinghuense]